MLSEVLLSYTVKSAKFSALDHHRCGAVSHCSAVSQSEAEYGWVTVLQRFAIAIRCLPIPRRAVSAGYDLRTVAAERRIFHRNWIFAPKWRGNLMWCGGPV